MQFVSTLSYKILVVMMHRKLGSTIRMAWNQRVSGHLKGLSQSAICWKWFKDYIKFISLLPLFFIIILFYCCEANENINMVIYKSELLAQATDKSLLLIVEGNMGLLLLFLTYLKRM